MASFQKVYVTSTMYVSGTVMLNAANAQGQPDGIYTGASGDESWVYDFNYDPLPPPGNDFLTGTQTVRYLVRSRSTGGTSSNPASIESVDLYVDGSFVRTIATPGTLSTTSSVLTATFNASEVGAGQPSIRITTDASGGSPSGREAVQVDYVELELQFSINSLFEDVTEAVNADSFPLLLENYVEAGYVEPYWSYSLVTAVLEDEEAVAAGETEVITQSRGVSDDLLEDATGEPELLSAVQDTADDLLEDATGEPELLTATQGAAVDAQEDAAGEPELLTATQAAVADQAADADSDDTILTEEQSSDTGDEFTEEIDREATILQQVAAHQQAVAEDTTGDADPLSAHKFAADDLTADADVAAEIAAEQPFYVADVEALAETHAELLSSLAALVGDEAADTDGTDEVAGTHVAGHTDQAEDVDAKDGLVARDNLTEDATAAAGVPVDPLREDVTEWIWPRDRVAQVYSDDVEEIQAVEVSYGSKLFLDIAVDVDALPEMDGEHRDNRTDQAAQADAEALVEATISALADLEEEAYIGGAVTNAVSSFYNTLVEDADGSDELTQRLVTGIELAADANGRDDVAGSAWFKAHSFIEDATASEELLSETIRRPTKDDVAEDVTGDVATLSATLHAVAAWSEDTLAEDELLGNESGEAWVFNTRTLAFSRYADFEASQVTTVDDEPLAAGARGVMAYSDTRAEGFVKTGLSDYGAPQLKRVRHAYITAASRQPLALSTLHGIGDTLQRTTYQVATLNSTVPYTHRLNLARGDQGQFWAFELRAPAGPPTTLLNLRIIPLVTSRRI